jgi:formate hydrogenlyase subunit 6/NADH:ubiquinone oxidoreductase subunit I
MTELPLVDATRCTACGDCVVACPTACLEMAGEGEGLPHPLPWLPRPRDCISCALCVLICPADALTMAEPPRA